MRGRWGCGVFSYSQQALLQLPCPCRCPGGRGTPTYTGKGPGSFFLRFLAWSNSDFLQTCYRAIFLFFLLLGLNWPSGARSTDTDRRHGRDGMARQTEQDFRQSQYQLFRIQGPGCQTDFTFWSFTLPPLLRTLITAAFSSNCEIGRAHV